VVLDGSVLYRFTDLVVGNADRVDGFVAMMVRTVNEAGDTETGLRDLARMYIRFVVRPEVLRLRRLVIAEAGRYPELARTYHERSAKGLSGARRPVP
jgi:TetR/AcrR family transcriptional regulator, mexJK operon transcriptional repressor